MDPVTGAIVAGLAGGVAEGLAAQAYQTLIAAIKRKKGEDSDLVEAVEKLEQRPESTGWQEEVETQVQATDANQDPELLNLAGQLIDALKQTSAGQQALNKYDVQIQDSQVGVIGDNTHVEGGMHFGDRVEQQVGTQTNIGGDVQGPVLSRQFNGPVSTGGGETVDMRGSQGGIYKPSGPVEQQFGDRINITGDGNVVADHGHSMVIKQNTMGLTTDDLLRLMEALKQALSTVNLDPDVAEAVEADLRMAETQARKPEPNRNLLLMRLGNVARLLATVDGVWGVSERVLPLAQQALAWAKQLYS